VFWGTVLMPRKTARQIAAIHANVRTPR
jgi:hypothetical protein